MIKSSKVIPVIACALSLSACLEVGNKSNQKVANAVTAQTQVLQEQKTSISLGGVVKNLSTDSKAINATVTVKTGLSQSAPVPVTNGVFLVENLPVDSDYELIVHSTTGAFMDKTQFGKTRATTSPGKIYQDLGNITVAAGVEHRFSILNASTSLPITNLVLHANSSVGTGANIEQYLHTASYDATIQQYKITFPEHMNIGVYANLDVNNDNKIDFLSESGVYGTGSTLVIDSTYVNNSNPIYLSDLNAGGAVKIKISLLDSDLKPILNAKPTISDEINGSLSATYDASTEQYVFNAIIASDVSVLIPAFTVGSKNYSSSTVQIYKVPESGGLSYSVTTAQSFSAGVKFAKDEAKIFNIVQQPMALFTNNISVSAKSTVVDAVSQGFKVFYSTAVTVAAGSATLVKQNVPHIIRGSDSASDFIVPGSTLAEAVDEPVAVTTQLSLDNTLLAVTPQAALEGGYNYAYNIGEIADVISKSPVDVSGDNLIFSVKSHAAFDNFPMILDNNNYFNQGNIIQPTNTAGVASSAMLQPSQVYAYFPVALSSLKKLVLRKEVVIKDNVAANDVQNLVVVDNGQLSNVSLVTAVSLANTENVVGSIANYITRGATLSDGQWYAMPTGEYMSDNSTLVANTIRFSYVLETAEGVERTGVVTLPVY